MLNPYSSKIFKLFYGVVLIAEVNVQAYELDLRSLRLQWDDPVYLSYAADKDYTEYFADQGYDLGLNPYFGVSFKTEKVGLLGLLFVKGKGIVSIDDYQEPPTIVKTFNDIVEIKYVPIDGLAVKQIFYVVSSRLAYMWVSLRNIGDRELAVLVLFVFQKLPFERMRIGLLNDGFVFPLTVPPDAWQRRKLDRYQEDFTGFFISPTVGIRGVYRGIWELQALVETGAPFATGAGHGSLMVLGEGITLRSGEERSLSMFWGKIPGEAPVHEFLESIQPLTSQALEEIYARREELYHEALAKVQFESREQALLGFSSLLLLRTQFMTAENRLPYNYYLFSREPTWGWGHAGQVFHESIGTIAYAHLDPEGAMDSQRNFFAMQDESGYIPYRIGPYLRETIDGETSSAPLLNWENWKIYSITHDRSFLEEAYEHGVRFYNWWEMYRDKDKDGLGEWGGNPILECLRDSHNVVFQVVLGGDYEQISSLEALDLNCFLVREAEALAYMATELGLKEDARKWESKAERRKALINQVFWDPETSFYYHADMETNRIRPELKRKEMIAFLALWAQVAGKRQAELLIEQLTDPKLFWRKFGVASLAANDPYYSPETGLCKWNGPVWPQWQYLFFEGLLRYGYRDLAEALFQKLANAIIYWLKDSHKFWEHYNPDFLTEQKSHKDYYWTGIIFQMLWELYKKN